MDKYKILIKIAIYQAMKDLEIWRMIQITIYNLSWRRARVVEGAGLQNQYIIGSNPIDASNLAPV